MVKIKNKIIKLENPNTMNVEKRADSAFKVFLCKMGAESDDCTHFNEPELSSWLSKFWFGARMNEEEPKLYTVSSMKNFKYSFNRILRKAEHEFDIMKSPSFKSCMEAFDNAMQGKGFVKNQEEINEEGI